MIEQIYTYFTIETLYMWINRGVLPFWLILIFFPQSHLNRIFVASILPIFVLSGVYIFILYKSYLIGYDFIDNFTLYLGSLLPYVQLVSIVSLKILCMIVHKICRKITKMPSPLF